MRERGIFHELFSTFLLKMKDITSCLESVEISHPFLSRTVGVFLKDFGKETVLMNLCNVKGKVLDLKRRHSTQSE